MWSHLDIGSDGLLQKCCNKELLLISHLLACSFSLLRERNVSGPKVRRFLVFFRTTKHIYKTHGLAFLEVLLRHYNCCVRIYYLHWCESCSSFFIAFCVQIFVTNFQQHVNPVFSLLRNDCLSRSSSLEHYLLSVLYVLHVLYPFL